MARFYASISGQAPTTATRRGSKSSGISGHIRGWDSGVRVEGSYDPDTDADVFRVYATAGSNGHGADRLIATITDGVVKAESGVAA
jgi:hypothetical protein